MQSTQLISQSTKNNTLCTLQRGLGSCFRNVNLWTAAKSEKGQIKQQIFAEL